MCESKADRFRRVAEARVNKIVKMLRLLGNCSGTNVYEYDDSQIEQIFTALQIELDTTRYRYANAGTSGHKRFSLSKNTTPTWGIISNPHITLQLPDGTSLRAVSYADKDYPAVSIYLLKGSESAERICFAEYNPERAPYHAVCIGAYVSDKDDTTYYAPYYAAERGYENETHENTASELG